MTRASLQHVNEKIISHHKEYNNTATFYFLPSHDSYNGIKNADYSINDPYIRKIISLVEVEENFKIGLHTPSCKSISPKTINDFINKISPYIDTNRYHYLAFQQSDLIKFEDTKITSDSSLGFAEHIGFRHSMAWPFHPFNFKSKSAINILEIPLNVMDVTFINKQYMGIDYKSALKEIQNLKNEIEKVNGTLTILWHNNLFFDDEFPFPQEALK